MEVGLLRLSDDTWQGSGLAATQGIRGFTGNDTITSGALDDALSGGVGNDTLTGNGGRDVLDGGVGNDTVNARDGVVDTIDCGDGVDIAVADANDSVANCETVQLPAVAPPIVTAPVAVVPVTGAISGPKAVTKPAKAKFTFSSATAGATFQCKVDAKAWTTCASPYKVATKRLKPGKHTVSVRAVLGGQVDATAPAEPCTPPPPSTKVFRVRRD
ncbi:MAG: hypothetical protein JWN68_658 [Nocardioides sp.]|nr:hypothetical protein [Nocardioides sp.]